MGVMSEKGVPTLLLAACMMMIAEQWELAWVGGRLEHGALSLGGRK